MNFYIEKLNNNLFEELFPIFQESLIEVYGNKDNQILAKSLKVVSIYNTNIDYNFFLQRQLDGKLNICTARENGKLVGYHVCLIDRHTQSKDLLVGTVQHVHVLKEYRKDNNGSNFLKFVEKVLKEKGVKLLFMAVNPKLKTDKLLERMGFTIDEIVYSKGL